ncbi:hypothetical protein OF83DRAFT_19107 [Amylostereum chailletii]|nr:hypothetical protein OF83DRAFT_19107 [Amylostereum chailletii]
MLAIQPYSNTNSRAAFEMRARGLSSIHILASSLASPSRARCAAAIERCIDVQNSPLIFVGRLEFPALPTAPLILVCSLGMDLSPAKTNDTPTDWSPLLRPDSGLKLPPKNALITMTTYWNEALAGFAARCRKHEQCVSKKERISEAVSNGETPQEVLNALKGLPDSPSSKQDDSPPAPPEGEEEDEDEAEEDPVAVLKMEYEAALQSARTAATAFLEAQVTAEHAQEEAELRQGDEEGGGCSEGGSFNCSCQSRVGGRGLRSTCRRRDQSHEGEDGSPRQDGESRANVAPDIAYSGSTSSKVPTMNQSRTNTAQNGGMRGSGGNTKGSGGDTKGLRW